MTTVRHEYEKSAMHIQEEKEKVLIEYEECTKKSINLYAEKDQIRKKKAFSIESIELKTPIPIDVRRRIRKKGI